MGRKIIKWPLSGFRKAISCHLKLWQDRSCWCPERRAASCILRAEHYMPRNLVISCREEWVLKKPNCLRWKMRQNWQCFLKFCLGVQLTSDRWKKTVLLELPVKWSQAHYGWKSEHGFNPKLQDNTPYEWWAQTIAIALLWYDQFMDGIMWYGCL